MIDPAFEPHYRDFIAIAVIVGVLPQITAFYTMPKVRALPAEEQDRMRPRFYVEAMLLQWVLAFVAVSAVLWGGLPLGAIGLSLRIEDLPRVGLGALIVGTLLAFLEFQRRNIRTLPDGRELVLAAIDKYAWIIPRSSGQRRIWLAVSTHAGIGEELFFRGYLLALLNWYLPLWAAAAIAVVLFGLGHTYQGVKGVVSTGVIGAILMGLYLLTGSLWVSIVAHAVYDMSGGRFAHWALYERDSAQSDA